MENGKAKQAGPSAVENESSLNERKLILIVTIYLHPWAGRHGMAWHGRYHNTTKSNSSRQERRRKDGELWFFMLLRPLSGGLASWRVGWDGRGVTPHLQNATKIHGIILIFQILFMSTLPRLSPTSPTHFHVVFSIATSKISISNPDFAMVASCR